MGTICPCTRDHRIDKRSLSDGGNAPTGHSDSKLAHAKKTPVNEQSFLTIAEEIQQLIAPIEKSFQKTVDLQSFNGCKLFKATYISTGHPCLIQVIKKNERTDKVGFKNRLIGMMSKLEHPNILRMYEMAQDAHCLYIISESYDSTNLENVIATEGCLSEELAATMIRQVLSGIAFAHSQGILHKSLTAQTVVLKNDLRAGPIVTKITGFEKHDLGFSPRAKTSFSAPESTLSQKSDMWSCGVLLVYLLSGRVPEPEILHVGAESALATEPWAIRSPEVLKLAAWMLSKRSRSRPGALECLAHPWFKRFSQVRLSVRSSVANMRECAAANPMKEALTKLVVHRVIPESEVGRLAEAFRALDTDGDGFLSENELLSGFCTVLPEPQAAAESKRVMAVLDPTHSGLISYSAFLRTSFSTSELLTPENLAKAFALLDIDHSGGISLQELKRFFTVNSPRSVESLWKTVIADMTEGRELSFEEFQTLVVKAVSA